MEYEPCLNTVFCSLHLLFTHMYVIVLVWPSFSSGTHASTGAAHAFCRLKIADEWTGPSHGMLNTKQRENYVKQWQDPSTPSLRQPPRLHACMHLRQQYQKYGHHKVCNLSWTVSGGLSHWQMSRWCSFLIHSWMQVSDCICKYANCSVQMRC